ncbi:hypothetical protein RCH18_001602 [Flavobacterium sp. PL11]|jgi:hypothetical protein|uniref:hypothetical protein n=1 Tax=Flavobacterium sp. PL11 TaxID=3071717 RepID=UPI002DFE11E9|nr:hypothetical protein [Flavobacterium sp. PL11]
MEQIKQLHYNDIGTSFYWRKDGLILYDRVQLIFRKTGFYFSKEELQFFSNCIEESFLLNKDCATCDLKKYCHQFLLKTPFLQIDLAVTMHELDQAKDLIEGTLFKIKLDEYLFGVGMN